jgi:polyisoprenoid-binding protein YceI
MKMKKISYLLVMIFVAVFSSLSLEKTWKIDNAHSSIIFSVSHMVIAEVSGYFREFEGTLNSYSDDFDKSQVEVKIKGSSITTDNEARDKHLKSPDFFDVEKYPTMIFKSTSAVKTGDNTFDINGELTMKGVTKSIVLKAKLNGVVTDPYGNLRSGWKAVTIINRFDYGIEWNKTLDSGGLVVGKEVSLVINVEFVLQK